MSRTAALQKGTKNPSRYFIDVKCGDGEFRIYDQTKKSETYKGEKATDVIKFALLDFDLFSITGYNETIKKGIYSNEVRSVNDLLKIRYNGPDKKDIIVGAYSEIKEAIKAIDGNYTRCVYGMMPNGEICHIKISGAGLNTWIKQIENGSSKSATHWVEVNEWIDKKKGRVDYKEPQFEFTEKLSKEEFDKAEEKYNIVQAYLKTYLANGGQSEKSSSIPSDAIPSDDSDSEFEDDDAPKIINTDEWKTYQFRKDDLYNLTYESLINDKAFMEENNDVESEDYQFVCRAIKEHQTASKEWRKHKTDKGTPLNDCDLEKLQGLLAYLEGKRPNHAVKIYVQAGIRELTSHEEEDDDDDIPF